MHRHTRSLVALLLAGGAACACKEDRYTILEQSPPLQSTGNTPPDAGSPPPASTGTASPDAGAASEDGTSNDDSDADEGDVTDTRKLPDLVLDTAYLVETAVQDFVEVDDSCLLAQRCVTGLGTRRVVRFGTRTGNAGTADLIVGKPDAENPLWKWDECAENYQLEGYARYDLLAEPSGEEVLRGEKNGFCMRDSEGYDLPTESCQQYDCEDQGITLGCADNYIAGLACQWVDITGIAPGTYRIKVQINADQHLEELDYSNNTGFIDIRIETTEVTVLGP
jgi:lysyl oxidase